MKIEQKQVPFEPVVLTIETKEELSVIVRVFGAAHGAVIPYSWYTQLKNILEK